MRFNNIYSYRNHTFELPIMCAMQALLNSTMALYVVNVRVKFIVQLMFQTRPKLHAPVLSSSSSSDASIKSYKFRKQRFNSFQYMCYKFYLSRYIQCKINTHTLAIKSDEILRIIILPKCYWQNNFYKWLSNKYNQSTYPFWHLIESIDFFKIDMNLFHFFTLLQISFSELWKMNVTLRA